VETLEARQKWIGLAAISGSICCWGLTPVLLRDLTSAIDAFTANGFRYPLAAALYWPILYHQWRIGNLTREVWKASFVPAALTGIGQVFWALSPYYLPASTIGFYIRLSLFFSLVAAAIVFQDERRLIMRPRFMLGVLITLLGLMALAGPLNAIIGSAQSTGVIIISLCSLFFGLYAVSVRIWMAKYNPLLGFGCVCQIVSAWTLGLMLIWGHPETLMTISAKTLVQLTVASILGIAVGHFLLYTAVRNIGAALSSAAHTITPFLTAVLASIFLGELLTGVQWLGGLAMFGGAMLLLSTQFRWSPFRRGRIEPSGPPSTTASPTVPKIGQP